VFVNQGAIRAASKSGTVEITVTDPNKVEGNSIWVSNSTY